MGKGTSTKYDVARNAGKLLSANILVQGIAFATFPFLSRLFTPADFGLLALFLSIGDMVGRMGTLSLEEASLLPKRHKEACRISAVGLYSVTITAFFTLLFVSFDQFAIKSFDFPASFFLLPLYVLIIGLTQLSTYLFSRFRFYKEISFAITGTGLSNAAFRLLSGFCRLSYVALIVSSLLSQLAGLLIYLAKMAQKGLFRLFNFPSYADTKKTLRKYKEFPAYVMTRNFVNSLSGNLPYFMLVGTFGATEIGLYSMAHTMAFRPINVFSTSVYQVLFEKFSSLKNENKPLLPLFRGYLKTVFLLALPLFLVCDYFAEELFGLVFGMEWTVSGRYFRIILPWIFMVLLSVPLSSIALVFSKQKWAFWIDIVYLLLRAGSLGLGILLGDMKTALTLFSISGALIMGLLLCFYLIWIKKHDRSISFEK